MAYHDAALLDEVRDFLLDQAQSDASEKVKQPIWRIFTIAWYKFARDATQAIELLTALIKYSKPTRKNLDDKDGE